MRCAITIAYDGTHFLGSQTQENSSNTVFGRVQSALKKLHIDAKASPSGRTDRGVHATGQVFHIDLPDFWSNLNKLKTALNIMLPPSMSIKKIKAVDDDFHARYSAKRRVYRYVIKEGESNPFEDNFVTFLEHVDFDSIEKNIKCFCGTFDFKYFMKSGSDIKSTTRTIYRAFAYKHKGFIILNFEANGFLRSQIRLMVGALLTLNTEMIEEQLLCRKKYKIKPEKSNGLYLSRIKY